MPPPAPVISTRCIRFAFPNVPISVKRLGGRRQGGIPSARPIRRANASQTAADSILAKGENMTIESTPGAAQIARPVPITVICVLSAIGVVLVVPMIFSEVARAIGAWYPPYLALSAIVGAACAVGFWLMRRWALYLYTAVFVINQIVLLTMGVWSIFALIIPGIVVGIGFYYQSHMR
jgi:hypothetical protein